MVTVQGPITLRQGTNELGEFILEHSKIKLPFVATGWESTKGMELIPDEYKKKGNVKKPIAKKLSKKEIKAVIGKSVVMEKSGIKEVKKEVKIRKNRKRIKF